MNTTVCNVKYVVWAMLFAGHCSSTSLLSAGVGHCPHHVLNITYDSIHR